MEARIYIAIPVKDRKKVVACCLPTIRDTRQAQDFLVLSNDGSTEFDNNWLLQFGDQIRGFNPGIGIQDQRRLHFCNYWEQRHAYTHLYLTDSDALHDPNWRAHALELQAQHGNPLVCLYNTVAHTGLPGNVIEDNPASNVIWQKYAPGISYLLTREHVEKVMRVINDLQHFDWMVPSILGYRCAISRVSYCDHIGQGGERHDGSPGYDGGDRATNPTPWLVEKRREIVRLLSA